jgi:hypothetical protein
MNQSEQHSGGRLAETYFGETVMDQHKDFKELNDLLTISQVAKRLPGREGKGKSIQTVTSWADKGLKGVRLKTIQIGGIRYMSWEWVLEFFERLEEARARNERTPRQIAWQDEKQKAVRSVDAARRVCLHDVEDNSLTGAVHSDFDVGA